MSLVDETGVYREQSHQEDIVAAALKLAFALSLSLSVALCSVPIGRVHYYCRSGSHDFE